MVKFRVVRNDINLGGGDFEKNACIELVEWLETSAKQGRVLLNTPASSYVELAAHIEEIKAALDKLRPEAKKVFARIDLEERSDRIV